MMTDEQATNWHVAHYEPGPNWLSGAPICDQPLDAHVDYLRDLHKKRQVMMAGPFADSTGGLVVFASGNKQEVEAAVLDDPAVCDGTLTAVVKSWVRVL